MIQKVIKKRARTILRRMIPELYDSHRFLDLAEEKKHEKTIGKHMVFEKSCFSLRGASSTEKALKMIPKCLPNGGQNAPKTHPKTMSKKRRQNDAKMTSKWSPNGVKMPPKIVENRRKMGADAREAHV